MVGQSREESVKNNQLLAYFGHHKCATVWIHSILTEVCRDLSLKLEYVHSHNQFNGDLESFVKENDLDFITYANANMDYVAKLKNFKGFHVIRDPRDIAVSSYFSHLHSHPTDGWRLLAEHREKLQKASKQEGLFLDINFINDGVYKVLERWNYHLPHILEIKMEELTREPSKKFVEIFGFLGIIAKGFTVSSRNRISIKKLEKILEKKSFSTLSGGRKKGQENAGHHFRKGIAGDWANHFTEEHKKYFKEKYNDLLIKLGYEKNSDW